MRSSFRLSDEGVVRVTRDRVTHQDAEKVHQRYWKVKVQTEMKQVESSLDLDLSLPRLRGLFLSLSRRRAPPLTIPPSELTLTRVPFTRTISSMVTTWWSPQLNALLGSLVVAAGAWLAWDSFSLWGVFLVAGGVTGFLIWKGRTIGLVWAWATLLLGVESLAWPIVTMVRVRSTTIEPTDEQMETILSAALTGLVSAVFWITFSYGFFKRTGQPIPAASTDATDSPTPIVRSGRPRRNK